MARVTLIDSLGWQDGLFNLGLAYLSSTLKAAGHDVTVLDLNNRFRSPEAVADAIGQLAPQYVGFSVKSATFANAVELHKRLAARFPQITFLYGGPHISLSSPTLLDEVPAAVCFRGDAEHTLAEFVTRHAAGQRDFTDIAGVMYRDRHDVHAVETRNHTTADLDTLPLPDFSTFDSADALTTYPLLTSRGCPYKCTYCSVPAISGKFWVHRSPSSIIREIDHVVQTLKLRSMVIVDDNFTLHKRRTEAVCQAMIDRGYDLTWSCGNGIRADRIWPDTARLMYRAGCREVAFGIESWDTEVFDALTKGEQLEHIRHGIEVVQGAGIRVTGFFMIGLPGATYRSDLRTLATARRRLRLDNFFFGLTVPYPGTALWDWAQQEARFLVPWQNSYHISEVFRDGLERIKVDPVFDTPTYPAEARRKMFHLAHAAKSRLRARDRQAIAAPLLDDMCRPLVVVRSSRRDTLLRVCRAISPESRRVLVWKGSGAFLDTLDDELRRTYELAPVVGDGPLTAGDGQQSALASLRGGVVIIDVPSGAMDRYQNVVDFARALAPVRLFALCGHTLVPLTTAKTGPQVSAIQAIESAA